MANLKKISKFLGSLHGSRIFSAGFMGTTGQIQNQVDELNKTYAILVQQPDRKKAKNNFMGALLGAQALSVITNEELEQCLSWLEED